MVDRTVTRFAPSPTGLLHIGGARTALFNWLYANSRGGKFLLRIEDTDLKRSSDRATQQIFRSLEWLGLDWSDKAVFQRKNIDRHREVADFLIKKDLAYKCYSSQEEIQDFQKKAKASGISSVFRSPWREKNLPDRSTNEFVIRLRTPDVGTTQLFDKIKGKILWNNNTLDDLVLLRKDGSPTYMLAVVVDDHDMNISDVIRGDDHLTNTARQVMIYQALSWDQPNFAHIPLIHATDGTKLSKRHNATDVEEYRKMGYPPEALNNYLARLGWSFNNEEYFTIDEAVNWFSLKNIGKGPSRFDIKKLNNVSKYHINQMPIEKLIPEVINFARTEKNLDLNNTQKLMLKKSIKIISKRSNTFNDLFENSQFFIKTRPIKITNQNFEVFTKENTSSITKLLKKLQDSSWTINNIESTINKFVEAESIKYKDVAEPMRVALTGERMSPSIAEVLFLLGKDESFSRLRDIFIDRMQSS